METSRRKTSLWPGALAAACLLIFLGSFVSGYAQGTTATLNGIVSDQSKAVIPGANVVLKQEATGALRRTVTNADGFFTIVGLPSGSYTLAVESSGFEKFERTGIVLHPGDRISLSDIALIVAGQKQQVEVVGAGATVIPVDTSEVSHVITANQIQNLAVIGRSADELLKILPGVVYNDYDPGNPPGFTVQFNQGIGNYNVSGTRNTQIANLSDGANVIDPGCNCGSAQTPNMDMVAEVKVQTSNFAAENAAGPVVFAAVSKSGTANFHGEGYLYARHSIFNARDWRNNFFDTEKPNDSFYFPGFNIGGPLTKDRQKLFFFTGIEFMRQNHDLGVRPAVVPTEAMRKGDFSDANYINSLTAAPEANCSLTGDFATSGFCAGVPHNDQELNQAGLSWLNWGGTPLTPEMLQGGKINPQYFDPGGQILLNMYPLPNKDPRSAGGYNYTSNIINPEHRRQALTRIDYNISDNTKLYGKFNQEYQASPYPFTLWWYNSNDVPWPGRLKGDYNTYTTSISLVKVLDPSTTNEVVFGLTRWSMPHKVRDPEKVSRKALNYPYTGMFHNDEDQIPSLLPAWGGGLGEMYQPGGLFDPTVFANKWLIPISDNFSKVMGTHTMKFGAYFEWVENAEPTTFDSPQALIPTQWGGSSTGNPFADLLLGRIGEFSESTKNFVGDYRKREWSGYAQDSWKATRRLTVEMGARFQHMGWMYEKHGYSFGFDPSQYKSDVKNSGLVAPYLGWDGPKSIWGTPALLFSPRLGFAYDVSGTGSWVIRAGAGVFHYLDRNGDGFGAFNPPLITTVDYASMPVELKDLPNLDPTKYFAKPDLSVLEPNSKKIPTTYNWSFTISKKLPWSTVLETSYVASSSSHQMACTNCGMSINLIPEGFMFGHPRDDDAEKYRPYDQYGTINMRRHAQSQNYNSLQVTANRQVGRINFTAAYTFAKTLGVGGNTYGTTTDQFDARGRSYGILPYDRTHAVSVAYNVLLPGKFTNKVAKGMFEGWQVSGISQLQSGAPIRDISFGGSMAEPDPENPGQFLSFDWRNTTGTPDSPPRPALVCDPRKGVAEGQYMNPSCFAAPALYTNGTYMMPYLKGPAFQNHDVSLFKNFEFNESRKLQFRWSLYNFVNHPLWYFEQSDVALDMNLEQGVPNQATMENFGKVHLKRGRRLMQFALKFYF